MNLRVYRTDKGLILSDQQGDSLNLSTLEPDGHAIYERINKKLERSNRAYASGETITLQHKDDIAQLNRSQENPIIVLDLVGSFPLPVKVIDVREYTREQFVAASAQARIAATAYETRLAEIERIYLTSIEELKTRAAKLLEQKNQAIAATHLPSLDDILFL